MINGKKKERIGFFSLLPVFFLVVQGISSKETIYYCMLVLYILQETKQHKGQENNVSKLECNKTKLSELYLIGENRWWLGLWTLGEPSIIFIQGFFHPYVQYLDILMMLFPPKTHDETDQCSYSWSITNSTWNVYFSTSTMDIFLSKAPQFVFQMFSGCSLYVSVPFSVFHLPVVSEAYCFATVNVRSRGTSVTWAWSRWSKWSHKQPMKRQTESSFQSQTLAYSLTLSSDVFTEA